jgi:uncharacterized cupredoxin-like copper-binding protein
MLYHVGRRVPALSIAALAAAVGVAGCGGSDSSKSESTSAATAPAQAKKPASPPQKLSLEADDDGGLYFKPTKLEAKAGAVALAMENPKTTGKEHGIAVKGNGVDEDGPVVKPGKTATVMATLKPGQYTFYCDYDDHAKRGMKGTLTVK